MSEVGDPLEFCCGQPAACEYGGCYPYRKPPVNPFSAPSGDAQGDEQGAAGVPGSGRQRATEGDGL